MNKYIRSLLGTSKQQIERVSVVITREGAPARGRERERDFCEENERKIEQRTLT